MKQNKPTTKKFKKECNSLDAWKEPVLKGKRTKGEDLTSPKVTGGDIDTTKKEGLVSDRTEGVKQRFLAQTG